MEANKGWLATSGVVGKWEKVAEVAAAGGGNIPAEQFADAALTLINVFDLISGMGMAKSDMVGNATTVLKAAQAKPGSTLQTLISDECDGQDDGKIKKISTDGKTSTCALLWLVRALYFILKMLEPLVADSSKSLSACVLAGYDVSLKPHHGFMVKSTFQVAVKAAPSRDKFMKQLAPTDEEVTGDINKVKDPVATLLESLNSKLKAVSTKHLTAYES